MSAKWPLVLSELRPYMELPHPLPTHGHPADPDPTKGVRAAFAAYPPTSFSNGVRTESIDIRGVRTLLVRPPEGVKVKQGIVIYVIHPGGFILGAPESEAPLLSTFAEAGYVCVSPDYRLAPEHPYPAAHNDVCAVWEWLTSAEGGQAILDLDVSKIILFGTSAGSTLATYLTFRLASESANTMPRLVILDSPYVDSRLGPFPSMSPTWKPATEGYMWWAAIGCNDINRYLFGEDSSAAKDQGGPEGVFVNEYPLSKFQELASKLPPFHLLVGELDCLRDSALEFAGKLFTAGVRTDLIVAAGTPHFFTGFFPTTRVAQETKMSYLRAIDRALYEY